MLYEAAIVIQTRVRRPCALKDWAQSIAARSGAGKARVALARKLSVTAIMRKLVILANALIRDNRPWQASRP